MALSIEEAEKEYSMYITRMSILRDNLIKSKYEIRVESEIALEATYYISYNGTSVANLWWNVPNYLEFASFVDQKEKSFNEDYVRSYDDWSKFIYDIEQSLIDYVS